MKTTTIEFRVTPEARAAFKQFCKTKETSMSKMLTDFIHAQVGDQGEMPSIKKESKDDVIRARLTKEEKQALKQYCEAENTTYSEVIIRQIRTLLNNEPHFTREELKEVRLATSQLTRVGRNLNQIVRKINSGELDSFEMTTDYCEKMTEAIESQADALRSLIAKSNKRIV